MNCKFGQLPMTYLGLPLSAKKLSKADFIPLIQKFHNQLTSWVAKLLSIVGRLVLINGVLSALPFYYMSCIKLPIWVIDEIDKIRRNFLWHGVSSQKRMNLANWELVCTPKSLGGLGVMNLRVFNNVLLLKWCWKWVSPEMNLIKPWFQNMAISNECMSVALSKLTYEVNQFWNISTARVVGNGMSISFWHHDWGFGIATATYPDLYSFVCNDTQILAEVLNTTQRFELRQPLSTSASAQLLALTEHMESITLIADADQVKWRWTKNEIFTVKSTYLAFKDGPRITNNRFRIWSLRAPPRFKVFA